MRGIKVDYDYDSGILTIYKDYQTYTVKINEEIDGFDVYDTIYRKIWSRSLRSVPNIERNEPIDGTTFYDFGHKAISYILTRDEVNGLNEAMTGDLLEFLFKQSAVLFNHYKEDKNGKDVHNE